MKERKVFSKIKRYVKNNQDKILQTGINAYRYREQITSLFHHMDLKTGRITLTEDMFNTDFKEIILEQVDEYINDINIKIDNNTFYINAIGEAKGIVFKAIYILKITRFQFDKEGHFIELDLEETIGGNRGILDELAIGIIKGMLYGIMKKNVIEKVIDINPGVCIDSNKVSIFLDEIPQFQRSFQKEIKGIKILSLIQVDLLEGEEGQLTFQLKLLNE